jgi:hypothetical protein
LIRANDGDPDAHGQRHLLPRAAHFFQRGLKISGDCGKRCANELGPDNDDEVKIAGARVRLVLAPEQLSHAPFRAIPINGASHSFRCNDAQTIPPEGIRPAEQCEVPSSRAAAARLNGGEFGPASQSGRGAEPMGHERLRGYSEETVRRFRPLVRRRLRTIRPFLVLIRTRNP